MSNRHSIKNEFTNHFYTIEKAKQFDSGAGVERLL
jgi:hypothetical protein